jgi:hypothetical protein
MFDLWFVDFFSFNQCCIYVADVNNFVLFCMPRESPSLRWHRGNLCSNDIQEHPTFSAAGMVTMWPQRAYLQEQRSAVRTILHSWLHWQWQFTIRCWDGDDVWISRMFTTYDWLKFSRCRFNISLNIFKSVQYFHNSFKYYKQKNHFRKFLIIHR